MGLSISIESLDESGHNDKARQTHANPMCPHKPQKIANGQLTIYKACEIEVGDLGQIWDTYNRALVNVKPHVSQYSTRILKSVARTVQAIDRVRGPNNSIVVGVEEIDVLVMRRDYYTLTDTTLEVGSETDPVEWWPHRAWIIAVNVSHL